MELLHVSLFVSSLIVLNRASPLQQPGIAHRLMPIASSTESRLVENPDEEDEEGLVDFEDEGPDALLDLVDNSEGGADSLMHLHEKGGEILVPCFGMWWPVGGGGPTYEYVDDYYGDYKKKRRSRKKKKAAKMKRKKS